MSKNQERSNQDPMKEDEEGGEKQSQNKDGNMMSPSGNPDDDGDASYSDDDDDVNGRFPFKKEVTDERPITPPTPRDKKRSNF